LSATTIYSLPSGPITTSGNSVDIAVGNYAELAIDSNITAVAGTSPTFQLFIDRKGSDGVYYQIWNSSSMNATGQISDSVGAGLNKAQSFGGTARVRWVLGGTSPSFTLSISLIGK
jgi:hypothetical protein